jgi:hypothetical protein
MSCFVVTTKDLSIYFDNSRGGFHVKTDDGLPDGRLEAKAMEGSPSVVVMFSHSYETRCY